MFHMIIFFLFRKFSTSKFLIIILIIFLIEIILRTLFSFIPPCEFEFYSKILLLTIDALKGIFLSIFIILHSRIWNSCKVLPNLKIFTKQGTTESNVNLSLPRNFSAKAINQQDSVDWDNFVASARKSIIEHNENFYSAEPRPSSVSSQPDPCRFSIISQDSISGHLPRDSLRSIMFRAKHNMSRSESVASQAPIAPLKCVVPPPVPKNIPDEILDDVQLFEYYYNNLSSISSSSSDVNQQPKSEEPNIDQRSSFHKISKIFNKPSRANPRLCRMSAFDETANENENGENSSAKNEIK